MNKFEAELEKYNYEFPANLIAQKPASPRDSAKLLVYDRESKTITHSTYKNLPKFLPEKAVIVFNETKVMPARFEVTKPTGGKARLLYLGKERGHILALSDRKLEIGSKIKSKQFGFFVSQKHEKHYELQPLFPISKLETVLQKIGTTPLPPYIKHSPLKGKKLLAEYNTVFAKITGSVAAPTASLHFTKQLLNNIKKQGADICFVTLHVGLGTFAPLTEEQLRKGVLHPEYYEISKKTATLLNKAKAQGRPIIAVGTTVTRTLEAAAQGTKKLKKLSDETTLMISEKRKPTFVDQLITNFHVPKSSLMMLVSAFVGRKQLLTLYALAIKLKYRLFSFGDGMYIK